MLFLVVFGHGLTIEESGILPSLEKVRKLGNIWLEDSMELSWH
jgi:hypothetical protein